MSSITAQRAIKGNVGYNSSKAALDHFARCLALEEAENGIRVNVVSPGIILVDHHVKRTGQDPKTAEGYACKITDMHQCH